MFTAAAVGIGLRAKVLREYTAIQCKLACDEDWNRIHRQSGTSTCLYHDGFGIFRFTALLSR